MGKRRRLLDDNDGSVNGSQPAQAQGPTPKRRYFGKSHLLALPQELILRVLHFLPVQILLIVSRVSRKLHALASDQQLWKTKFWAKFILPRLQRRARLSIPDSHGSREPEAEPGTVADWKMWLEDHVLIQEERNLAALVPSSTASASLEPYEALIDGYLSSSKQPEITKPTLDWKGKFRLRSNWQRGVAQSSQLGLLNPVSNNESKAPHITGKFYEGYFFSADTQHGVRVFGRQGHSKELVELARRSITLGEPTCMCLEESLLNDTSRKRHEARNIDFVVGYNNGSYAIYHFNPTSGCLHEKYIKNKSDEIGTIEIIAFHFPYLLIIARLSKFQLSIINFQSSVKKKGAVDLHDGLLLPDISFLPPTLVKKLSLDQSWLPSCLSLRKDPVSKKIIGTCVFTVRSVIIGTSITIQEFHLSSEKPGILETQTSSPPLHEALDYVFFGRAAQLAFTAPTCVSYRYPFIMTSHADNTLVLYNMFTNKEGKIEILSGHRLWGHNSSIMSVEVGLRRAVSVDRRGEVRFWDLQERLERTYGKDRSTRLIGSGDPLSLNIGGVHNFPKERCAVGFGEENVVVLEKVTNSGKDNKAGFELLVYDFT
ncbi:hypothetical protein TWF225_011274 [Orbilia oligospora]|nr:hypothetical protein TWF751_003623 [Orbilia oligospora]KAF3169649.1 hypothetical protein TWF225_011274 [Orbilia oligospora]KAF3235363.1 hypothetical protein TWF217_003152 [Orbilia oligospora]KAF3235509.1 hypothetical protein TWF128_001824 [Orbilia oligospora]KAF3282909.1 hypothetical protein TWF132_010546 [Orbilia oligospora]